MTAVCRPADAAIRSAADWRSRLDAGRKPGRVERRRRVQDERRAALQREAVWFGERAVLAHLDGYHPEALEAADRGVQALQEWRRLAPDDPEPTVGLAEAVATRAEIRLHLSKAEHRAGIRDATAALELYAGADAQRVRVPMAVANVRLARAELHSSLGHHRRARRDGDEALASWRDHDTAGGPLSEVMVAHAWARYGAVVARCGDEPAATAALRESVERARPHSRPAGWLWQHRFDVGTTRITTPTLERFADTAHALASLLPYPDAAWQALQALQDAAEGYAALIPELTVRVALPVDEVHRRTTRILRILQGQADGLAALAEPDLADAYRAARYGLLANWLADWHAPVVALRAPLTAVLQRRGAGP